MSITNWQAQLDRLYDIQGRGVLRTRMPDGKEVVFADGKDLADRIAKLESRIALARQGGKRRSSVAFATFTREGR